MTAPAPQLQPMAEATRQDGPWSGSLSADLRKGALSVNADGLTLIDAKGICWGIVFPDKTGSYDHVPSIVEAVNSHASLKARIHELEGALRECIEAFVLVERPAFLDPDYSDEVTALGDRIGYGALMTSASASWRAALTEQDCPVGGEFVAGPCHVTVLRTLKIARSALSPKPAAAPQPDGVARAITERGDV